MGAREARWGAWGDAAGRYGTVAPVRATVAEGPLGAWDRCHAVRLAARAERAFGGAAYWRPALRACLRVAVGRRNWATRIAERWTGARAAS